MRIRHRYTFRADNKSNREIINFLDKRKIKYRVTSGIPILIFKIYEDEENWCSIDKLMRKHEYNPISECVYTKKELDNAAWLRIRSKYRWEYPQPEDEYKSITYDDSEFCNKCGCGLTQKSNFKVKKSPSWGKKNFLMLNWIEDELFVSGRTAEVLENSELKGFNLLDVLYSKKNIPIDNMKQILVKEILKPGMIIGDEYIEKEIVCNQCNCNKFISRSRGIYYKKDVFKEIDVDIIKSDEMFGDGYAAQRDIIVSNAFYKLVIENGLDKSLAFEPINLIK